MSKNKLPPMSSEIQNNQNLENFTKYEMSSSWSKKCAVDRALLYHIGKHDIHVLLVDHDKECLLATANMLELYSYKVSGVELGSTALMMLSDGSKFDVVMANVHSPDLLAMKLLDEAVKMKMLVILISDFEDPFIARRTLERGAFLYVKKPASIELVKCLWQYVVRERKQKGQGKENLQKKSENDEKNMSGLLDETTEKNSARSNEMQDKGKGKIEVITSGQEVMNGELEDSPNYTDRLGKRVWTLELHAKFLDAIKQLGEGRCFPSEILALMNVPGLTRMQVASHLQKCRCNSWHDPCDRKRRSSTSEHASHDDETQEEALPKRRFGSMPPGENRSNRSSKPAQALEDVQSLKLKNAGSNE